MTIFILHIVFVMYLRLAKNAVLGVLLGALLSMASTRQSLADVKPIFNDSAGYAYTVENSTFEDSLDQSAFVAPERLSSGLVFLEIMGLNVLVWGWDRYVLDKDYAHTGPSYWKRNLREGWEWDHNHWAINFYGHPYQGAYYFMAGRSAGYDFYSAFFGAFLGSYTWEMFAETEYPSINDLLVTSVGGSMYGEVLYRLSRKLHGTEDYATWYRRMGAFALQPMGYVQRMAFKNRDNYTGNTPMKMDVFLGSGMHFGNNYRFGGKNADELDEDWDDRHVMFGMDIEYGRPYTKVKRPFDYFTLNAMGESGPDGALARLDVTGKLNNVGAHGRGHWVDFATYLDYDTFYGDFATVGTVSLGGGIDLGLWLLPKVRFRMMNQAYWVIIGSTDMGYDDLIKEAHPEYTSDKDNYQYNMGAKYSLYLELWMGGRFLLSNRTNLVALHTMPNSIPHYGAYGWDFLIFNYTKAEYDVFKWLAVGAQLDTYVKFAAYSTELFEPMSRRMFAYTVYFTFRLF